MVKSYNNKTFAFWERSLFQRACSVLQFDLPDHWDGSVRDFFYYCLFKFGYVVISENNEYGIFFQPCTLNGYDFYYQPTNALISNPVMQADLKIGEDCELLKLCPDYMGIWDIISYYSEKLSVLDNAINISLINSKLGLLMGVRSKAAAEALKKMLDKLNKGEPAVFYDKKIFEDPDDPNDPIFSLDRDLKKSYITTEQLMDFQTIINNFDTEIGIPVLPYQKKERMVTSEAESKIIDSTSRSVVWYDTLTASIDAIKELYPNINLDVKLRFDESEVSGNGNS